MYAVQLNSTVLEILKLGLSGFCFLLAFLGYLLLAQQQKLPKAQTGMLSAIKFFLIVAIVLGLLVATHSVASAIYVRDEAELARLRTELKSAQDALVKSNTDHEVELKTLSSQSAAAILGISREREKAVGKLMRIAEAVDAKFDTEKAHLERMARDDPNKNYAELVLGRIKRMQEILKER